MTADPEIKLINEKIARLKERRELIENLNKYGELRNIRRAKDASAIEKVEFYDKMHKMACDYVVKAIREHYVDRDDEHWFFEETINNTLGKETWELINEVVR